jgi:hypothetical protein
MLSIIEVVLYIDHVTPVMVFLCMVSALSASYLIYRSGWRGLTSDADAIVKAEPQKLLHRIVAHFQVFSTHSWDLQQLTLCALCSEQYP